ncbi:GNAT family N-acyltransferase [Arsukibacterium indicum]|uniref:Lysophospholipid acyltransferase family protein n=1 Tax=Arsukibacterium indicum TaxID=2848612 RepID=A0ABS6MM94_9GAMM|nr:lysophospholipid acyltransferase family protein [Arsukibacterium indicum]MBV2129431.1 lysophospholipid acyltransferase family protein [Arsukibacterium indicum]
MFNVEQVIQQQMPGISSKPWLYKPVKGALSYLLHEQEFVAFSQQYPHLQGLDFVEQVLNYFNFSYSARDNEIARIPASGKVVIIANHPIGSLDGLALIKLISEIRPDVKIIANQLLMSVTALHCLLLPVNNMEGGTERNRLSEIRRHLQQDGALVLFPAGEVSRLKPNGVRDGKWHNGFLRFATGAKAPILPIYIDGRNSALFYGASMLYKPLATMLLVQEMFKQQRKNITMRIGEQIPFDSYGQLPLSTKEQLKLFKKHLYRLAKDKAPLLRTQSTIAHPELRSELKADLTQCQQLGTTSDGKLIYLYHHKQSSALMREIGRLRELAFRAVGEGTGNKRDIDKYDSYYHHLILWDPAELEMVGAYRLAPSGDIIRSSGVSGLYTASLFRYNQTMQPYLEQGLELGRSFIQPRYWGKRSLDYLWYGIGAYLQHNPQIRYLFGAVSISASYPQTARDLLVYFYSLYFGADQVLLQANQPYLLSDEQRHHLQSQFSGTDYTADFTQLKHLLANMGLSVPTLYKQYSELCQPGGASFLAFSTDPAFADCVDGLVLVDLQQLKPAKQARYLTQAASKRNVKAV